MPTRDEIADAPPHQTRRALAMDHISHIIRNLTRTVRPAYRPPPRPQASWAALKPGDILSRADVHWRVESVDSDGATLRHPTAPVQERLTDRDWQAAGWTRVPKRRKANAAGGSK